MVQIHPGWFCTDFKWSHTTDGFSPVSSNKEAVVGREQLIKKNRVKDHHDNSKMAEVQQHHLKDLFKKKNKRTEKYRKGTFSSESTSSS